MSQPHTYSSAYPQEIKPESGIKEFFEKFYEISDTRDRHEDYAACFTEDATLFMGIKESRGFEGRGDGVVGWSLFGDEGKEESNDEKG
ncbi:hypothetical protein ACMFMG_010908 [Clarireedia jacksonii]